MLVAVFRLWSHGENRACTNIQWHDVEWRLSVNFLSPIRLLSCPEVVPIRASRQIHTTRPGVGIGDRGYENRRPKHEFVVDVQSLRILQKVERQGAHWCVTFGRGLVCKSVNVWQQPVAKTVVERENRLGVLAVRPEFILVIAPHSVHAEDRAK